MDGARATEAAADTDRRKEADQIQHLLDVDLRTKLLEVDFGHESHLGIVDRGVPI